MNKRKSFLEPGELGWNPVRRIAGKKLMQVLLLVASLFAPVVVHAQTQNDSMISISVPSADKVMSDGTVAVTIHLLAPADPSTLNVEANRQDITSYFAGEPRSQAPCNVTATLNANVVNPGERQTL